ncbi:MAG: hypothetical protein N3G75_08715 [Methanothrix sp.]|nr:hypothetical protein [Methanothrix sp.]MCX8207890.1 hypothetical protein [Methanothrix sp.]
MTDARKILQAALCLYPDIPDEDMEILWYLYAHGAVSTQKLSEAFGTSSKQIRARLETLRKHELVMFGLSRREYMLTRYVTTILATIRGFGTRGALYYSIPVGVMNAIPFSRIRAMHPDIEFSELQYLLRAMQYDGLIRSARHGKRAEPVYWRDPE